MPADCAGKASAGFAPIASGEALERLLQRPFQRLTEILQQMPAIGNLDSRWSPLARAVRVGTGAIPADDLHCGMIAEPLGERCGVAPQQEVEGTMGFHVHEDRPVGPPFAPAPIVHAENMRRARVRQCRRHHRTQERDATDGDTKFCEQPRARRTADSDTEDQHDGREAGGSLSEWSGNGRQPFGEDPARAEGIVAEPAASMQFHAYRKSLPR